MCIGGCRYRVEARTETTTAWQGNLGQQWPPSVAQTIVALAESHARWRSTRAAFAELGRYARYAR